MTTEFKQDIITALLEILTRAETELNVPGFAWHAVIVPDSEASIYLEYASASELAEALRPYANQVCECYAFYGRACSFTAAPAYLLTHEGKFPLFLTSGDDGTHVKGVFGKPPTATPQPQMIPTLEELESDDDDDYTDPDEDDEDEEDLT